MNTTERQTMGCLMILLGWQLSVMNGELLAVYDLSAIWLAGISMIYSMFGFHLIDHESEQIKIEILTENGRWVYE